MSYGYLPHIKTEKYLTKLFPYKEETLYAHSHYAVTVAGVCFGCLSFPYYMLVRFLAVAEASYIYTFRLQLKLD